MAAARLGLQAEQFLLRDGVGALLGFKDEAAALVQVDAAGGAALIGLVVGDAALEAIGSGAAGRGLGAVEPKQVAEFDQERRCVGALGLLGACPAGDEGGAQI